jgi:Cu2+-exporting ATPase
LREVDVASRCFHCGEALPATPSWVELDGLRAPVCCDGCAAAAAWIGGAGLGDYYRLRQREAPRVASHADDYAAWLHPEVLAEHAHRVANGWELTFIVEGMRCAACAWLIDRALGRIDGVLDLSANAVTGRVRVAWDPQRVDLPTLLQRLASLGFTPQLATGLAREQGHRRARRSDLMRLGVAGLGAMQAMMFAEALFLDTRGEMPLATRDFLRWIAFLVSTPVVFYAGWPFLAGMARELRGRRLGMDSLVAVSVLLAYGASLVETLRGGVHVWFDAAVMFVFLLLVARQLETLARRRARARIDALARARPALATRESDDGTLRQVALAALQCGDVVRVAAGDALPADGEVLDRAASLDESLLSGESRPVTRQPGEVVLAGSVCRENGLRYRITQTGSDTRLADLVRLVERAQGERPRLARLADRVAAWFALAMFVLSALVFVAWWQLEPARAFEIALAVLVVSCPCALSLAIPTALAAAHSSLARLGVLAVRGEALEIAARVDSILLDKTGTLTLPTPGLASIHVFAPAQAEWVRSVVAGLQRDSRHPLASAFQFVDAKPAAMLDGVESVPGQGLRGYLDRRELRLGRGDFATGACDDGAVWLGDGHTPLARFELTQVPRGDAAETLARLRAQGLALEISSGDGEDAVREVARQFKVARWSARQSPALKLERLRALQQAGHCVAMLGDGINDAPVLAGADVSFALGEGAGLAHRAADFVLAGTSLRALPATLALARRTRRVTRQNLAWAVLYNAAALPFAALGWVPPWLAALGMALSSLLVTVNALRLLRVDA